MLRKTGIIPLCLKNNSIRPYTSTATLSGWPFLLQGCVVILGTKCRWVLVGAWSYFIDLCNALSAKHLAPRRKGWRKGAGHKRSGQATELKPSTAQSQTHPSPLSGRVWGRARHRHNLQGKGTQSHSRRSGGKPGTVFRDQKIQPIHFQVPGHWPPA